MMSLTPITCSCSKCQSMCANTVCLPTPEEARELAKKFPERMAVFKFEPGNDEYSYVAPGIAGREHEILNTTTGGACTFFANGKCELHDLGLKPLEGRLAYHDRAWQPVRLHVQSTWKGKAFASVHATLSRLRNP